MALRKIFKKSRKMRYTRKIRYTPNKTRANRGGGGTFSCMGESCKVSPEQRNADIILKSLKRLEFNSYDDIILASELEKFRAMRSELDGPLANFIDVLVNGLTISNKLNYLYLKIKRNNESPRDSDIEQFEALMPNKIHFQEMSNSVIHDGLINHLIPIVHCINIIEHIERILIIAPSLKINEMIYNARDKYSSVTLRHQTHPRRDY